MAIRVKRAVPGRLVGGRFVPLAKNPSPGYKAYPTSLLKQLLDAPSQQVSTRQKKALIRELARRGVAVEHLARFYKVKNPKSSVEEVLYRKFRKEGYSRAEAKRFAKINAPYFGGAKTRSNPMKVAVTMLRNFIPVRGDVMLSGQRYYVRRADAEELKRSGIARITHEGKRKRQNPKSKLKTKVVKRDGHWFAEMESGGGRSIARYDTKAEAKKAVRDYRYIHRTGRFPNPFSSIAAIKKANRDAGHHFFDRESMKFFASKIHDGVIGGKYFITSEQPPHGPRVYSIREANDSGHISTVEKGLATLSDARNRARSR